MASSTLGFGTENLVFVPAGEQLFIFDIYAWRFIRFDVLNLYVRMKPFALEGLGTQLDSAVKSIRKRGAQSKKADDHEAAAVSFLRSLQKNPANQISATAAVANVPGFSPWIRLTDKPAETFFPEDYEEAGNYDGPVVAVPLYGNCHIEEMGDHEVPFPGSGEEAAFELLVPNQGIVSSAMAKDELLPLVDEYCGASGVSSHGNSVNITLQAQLSANHLGCVPLRRVGESVFATLYFNMNTEPAAQVIAPLERQPFLNAGKLLLKSRFHIHAEHKNCQMFVRDGDCVHIYHDVEGLEASGIRTMPPFIIVVTAGGTADPQERGELLKSILQQLNQ